MFYSIFFLFLFLPVFLFFYFSVPKKYRNILLLVFSLLFIYVNDKDALIWLALSLLLTFFSGLSIERSGKRGARAILFISVLAELSVLVFFKYSDLFTSALNSVFGKELPILSRTLPLGISFYTFSSIAYLADVYRKKIAAESDIIAFSAYFTLFPTIVSGPITRYSEIGEEIHSRREALEMAASGISRFSSGLAKKVIIADSLYAFCTLYRDAPDRDLLFTLLYSVVFTLYIYYDFSGYTDMAIGIGKMIGLSLPENFDYPYTAERVSEFWRRWHMSLTRFFKDYVYIPMGGNKVSAARHVFNILTVWTLTGLWHGSSLSFLLWGVYFGVIIVLEKYIFSKIKIPAPLLHTSTLICIIFGFLIFSAPSISALSTDIYSLMGKYGIFSDISLYYLKSLLPIIVISSAGTTPLIKRCFDKLFDRSFYSSLILRPSLTAASLLFCSAFSVSGSFSAFLYSGF